MAIRSDVGEADDKIRKRSRYVSMTGVELVTSHG